MLSWHKKSFSATVYNRLFLMFLAHGSCGSGHGLKYVDLNWLLIGGNSWFSFTDWNWTGEDESRNEKLEDALAVHSHFLLFPLLVLFLSVTENTNWNFMVGHVFLASADLPHLFVGGYGLHCREIFPAQFSMRIFRIIGIVVTPLWWAFPAGSQAGLIFLMWCATHSAYHCACVEDFFCTPFSAVR